VSRAVALPQHSSFDFPYYVSKRRTVSLSNLISSFGYRIVFSTERQLSACRRLAIAWHCAPSSLIKHYPFPFHTDQKLYQSLINPTSARSQIFNTVRRTVLSPKNKTACTAARFEPTTNHDLEKGKSKRSR